MVLEGGPGTLHVSTGCQAAGGSGGGVEGGWLDAQGAHMTCCPRDTEDRGSTAGHGCFPVGEEACDWVDTHVGEVAWL